MFRFFENLVDPFQNYCETDVPQISYFHFSKTIAVLFMASLVD